VDPRRGKPSLELIMELAKKELIANLVADCGNGNMTPKRYSRMWDILAMIGVGGLSASAEERRLPDGSIRRVAELQDFVGNNIGLKMVQTILERDSGTNEYSTYVA
jgi:hypothetical protein